MSARTSARDLRGGRIAQGSWAHHAGGRLLSLLLAVAADGAGGVAPLLQAVRVEGVVAHRRHHAADMLHRRRHQPRQTNPTQTSSETAAAPRRDCALRRVLRAHEPGRGALGRRGRSAARSCPAELRRVTRARRPARRR
eukprot:scaffold2213_cov444-Prasinococcus_capsulatus_cf.AAC.9